MAQHYPLSLLRINPPTDRPFKSIQMVLEGPLIHHLEVSKQGFVLAVLPFGKIQTRFCISWPTIQNHFGESTLYTVISPFKTTIANGFKWCINLYEKGTKSRRVNHQNLWVWWEMEHRTNCLQVTKSQPWLTTDSACPGLIIQPTRVDSSQPTRVDSSQPTRVRL